MHLARATRYQHKLAKDGLAHAFKKSLAESDDLIESARLARSFLQNKLNLYGNFIRELIAELDGAIANRDEGHIDHLFVYIDEAASLLSSAEVHSELEPEYRKYTGEEYHVQDMPIPGSPYDQYGFGSTNQRTMKRIGAIITDQKQWFDAESWISPRGYIINI